MDQVRIAETLYHTHPDATAAQAWVLYD